MTASEIEAPISAEEVAAEQAAYQDSLEAEAAGFDLESDPEPDADPAPEPEPESEPVPARAKRGRKSAGSSSGRAAERDTATTVEAALKRLEGLGDAYVETVGLIQAETDLGLVECPVCPVPGFVPAEPRLGMPEEQRQAVLAILEAPVPEQLAQHPDLESCPDCGGGGFMATGSHREGYTDRPCPRCGGNGYVDKRVEQALEDSRPPDPSRNVVVPPPPPSASLVPPMAGQVTQGGYAFYPTPGGASDPFGRIAGHPLWGQPADVGGI